MIRNKTLSGDLRFASHEFMRRSFAQPRERIVAQCLQLKQDVDWFNENRSPHDPIPLVLDFMANIAEIELLKANVRRSST